MINNRNYRIDFLRTVSMFLIVVQHYVVWGVKTSEHALFDTSIVSDGINYLLMEPLYLMSCIGVNCFVMISGYFMIDRNEFRWKSLINLWLTTMFYSVVLYVASVFISGNFDKHELLNCFLPIWSKQYWFISNYIVVMLFAPFLSKIAVNLSKRSYQLLLIILFIVSFMVPYGNQFAGGQSVMWMLFVFLVAGYIKCYGFNLWLTNHSGLISTALCVTYSLVFYAIDAIKLHHIFGEGFQLHGFASDSPIFFISLTIFLLAIRENKSTNSKWMSFPVKVAPYIPAVYLIHMNRNFYPYIWQVIIPTAYKIPMAFHSLLFCFVIFVVCIAIDWVRERLFQIVGIPTFVDKFSSRIKIRSI